ncbi:MAG: hypothetical protein B7Z73_08875, partial [Planctomycetia bacterium 21-64-5]
ANGLPVTITLPQPTIGAAAPVTNIYYDGTGDETYATGAQPTYGTFTYNSFGEWTTFTDELNHEWLRSFDSHGNLLSETTPSGNTVSWTVDAFGNPLTMTQPAPNDAAGTVTTQYVYDADERLIKIIWPDNTFRTFTYNALDEKTSVTDENNHTAITNYDVLGRTTSVVDAMNGTSDTTYDKDNNVLTTSDKMGNVTSNVWNSRNELVQQTLPATMIGGAAPVLTWTYDKNSNKLTYTDSLSRETQYAYNSLNELIQETIPAPSTGAASPTIEYAYNNLGQQVSETNPLGGVTTTNYGNTDVRQVTSIEQPPPSGPGTGSTTSYGYDADGRKDSVSNALNQTTTTSFTLDGEVSQTKDNLGHIMSYAYGNGGELLSTTDSLQHTSSRLYDSRNRLIQTTDANGGVTQIGLDGAGNEVKLVDSDNNETDWTFNALNLPVTETNSLGTTTTGYNADSEVTSIEDADGRVRDFVYNNDEQLTAENWMSGNTIVATMSYGYDLAGELTSASDPNSAYAFSYNGDGQVTSVDNAGTPNVPDVLLANGYDALGDRTSQSATIAGTADYLNSYSYDADQRLTAVTQQDQNGGNVVSPKEIDYDYNALGQVTDTWAYNTLSGPREDVLHGASSYDNGDRLTTLAYTSNAGATTIDTLGWTYNAASLITSSTTNSGTAAYAYDPTNQLTGATYTGASQPANESYSYTADGNRNSAGYTTGSDNLMTSDGTFTYQHDADGNTTVRTRIPTNYASDYRTTYTWDYRNRLTDVDFYDNNGVLTKHVHYVFDVFDNLIGEQDDDTGSGSYDQQQFYAVDAAAQAPHAGQPSAQAAQPFFVFDPTGNLTERNLLAPNPAGVDAVMAEGAVASLTQGDVATWTVDDDQGSVREVTNNIGGVIDTINYGSFGVVAYESDPTVVHWAAFAGGHVSAATGLENEGERWLNLPDGDWLNQDPSGFDGGDGNLSRDVGNDPTNAIDPTGLFGVVQWSSSQGGWMTMYTRTYWDNNTYSDTSISSWTGDLTMNT